MAVPPQEQVMKLILPRPVSRFGKCSTLALVSSNVSLFFLWAFIACILRSCHLVIVYNTAAHRQMAESRSCHLLAGSDALWKPITENNNTHTHSLTHRQTHTHAQADTHARTHTHTDTHTLTHYQRWEQFETRDRQWDVWGSAVSPLTVRFVWGWVRVDGGREGERDPQTWSILVQSSMADSKRPNPGCKISWMQFLMSTQIKYVLLWSDLKCLFIFCIIMYSFLLFFFTMCRHHLISYIRYIIWYTILLLYMELEKNTRSHKV